MLRQIGPTVALAIVSAAAPTLAVAGQYDKAIVEIIDAAIADWSILLSCSVLETETHEIIADWWDEERQEVAALLAEADVAPVIAADITARLSPDRLMEVTEGDAPTLIAFCADTDWRRQAAVFTYVRPAAEIENLLRP